MTFRRPVRLRGVRRLPWPPGSRSRLYALPVLLAALIAAGTYLWPAGHKDAPGVLSAYQAGGARDDMNCLRLVIGVDVSGSMSDFSVPRDNALTQLFDWVRTGNNLRPDDELAIVDFARVARTRMPPTQVDDLGSLPPPVGAADGQYTNLRPVLTRIGAFPRTTCDTALALISDAQLNDLPRSAAEGRQLLVGYRVDKIRLLVPGTGIQVYQEWARGFPSAVPQVFDGLDAEATGLALGHMVVGLTGQSLVPVG